MSNKAVVGACKLPLLLSQTVHYHQTMRHFLAVAALATATTLATALPAQNPGGIPWEDEPDRRMTVTRPTKGEWSFGVDGGWSNFRQAKFEQRATRFALFVERNIVPWLGVQGDVNCGNGTVSQTPLAPSSSIVMCTGALSAVVPIPVSYTFWPYVRVGAGLTLWNEQAVEGYFNSDFAEPAFVAAIGARYFPFNNDRIAIRLDAQRTQTTLRDAAVGQWGYGFGVSLRIPVVP